MTAGMDGSGLSCEGAELFPCALCLVSLAGHSVPAPVAAWLFSPAWMGLSQALQLHGLWGALSAPAKGVHECPEPLCAVPTLLLGYVTHPDL